MCRSVCLCISLTQPTRTSISYCFSFFSFFVFLFLPKRLPTRFFRCLARLHSFLFVCLLTCSLSFRLMRSHSLQLKQQLVHFRVTISLIFSTCNFHPLFTVAVAAAAAATAVVALFLDCFTNCSCWIFDTNTHTQARTRTKKLVKLNSSNQNNFPPNLFLFFSSFLCTLSSMCAVTASVSASFFPAFFSIMDLVFVAKFLFDLHKNRTARTAATHTHAKIETQTLAEKNSNNNFATGFLSAQSGIAQSMNGLARLDCFYCLLRCCCSCCGCF